MRIFHLILQTTMARGMSFSMKILNMRYFTNYRNPEASVHYAQGCPWTPLIQIFLLQIVFYFSIGHSCDYKSDTRISYLESRQTKLIFFYGFDIYHFDTIKK